MTFSTPAPLPSAFRDEITPATAEEPSAPAPESESSQDLDSAPAVKPKKPRASRGTGAVTSRAVRRILDTYEQVQASEALPRQILATALGTKEDPVEIVAALASQTRTSVPGVTELIDISDAASDGPFAAMAKATQHEAASKHVWQVLSRLGLVSGNLPSKDATAAMTITEAATKLSDEQQSLLHKVSELVTKA